MRAMTGRGSAPERHLDPGKWTPERRIPGGPAASARRLARGAARAVPRFRWPASLERLDPIQRLARGQALGAQVLQPRLDPATLAPGAAA